MYFLFDSVSRNTNGKIEKSKLRDNYCKINDK